MKISKLDLAKMIVSGIVGLIIGLLLKQVYLLEVALLLITAFYAYSTYLLVKQSEKQTEIMPKQIRIMNEQLSMERFRNMGRV